MLQAQLKLEMEVESLTTQNNEFKKEIDRHKIFKQEFEDQVEAKEELISSLEESLE